MLFQGPPRSKYLSYKCSLLNRYIQRLAKKYHDFSKIADLQARSAALGAALWACISAIFQLLKRSIILGLNGLNKMFKKTRDTNIFQYHNLYLSIQRNCTESMILELVLIASFYTLLVHSYTFSHVSSLCCPSTICYSDCISGGMGLQDMHSCIIIETMSFMQTLSWCAHVEERSG